MGGLVVPGTVFSPVTGADFVPGVGVGVCVAEDFHLRFVGGGIWFVPGSCLFVTEFSRRRRDKEILPFLSYAR